MKEITRKKKGLLDVNRKGNGLICAIGVLSFILVLSQFIYMNLHHIQLLSQYDHQFELMKIHVIQKVKKDFYDQKCEDFTIEKYSYLANVTYDEDVAIVVIEGQQNVTMEIIYDNVYLCIGHIEYFYENNSY